MIRVSQKRLKTYERRLKTQTRSSNFTISYKLEEMS